MSAPAADDDRPPDAAPPVAPRWGAAAAAAVALRSAAFLVLWLILIVAGPTPTAPLDVAVGLCAAVAAALASLRLIGPPQARSARLLGRARIVALGKLVAHLLRQSVWAGTDVALRALHPRLPLRTGVIRFQPRLSEGLARDVFCAMSSLLPGSTCLGAVSAEALPESPGAGAPRPLEYHCLDLALPVESSLRHDERLLQAVVTPLGDGGSAERPR
ncbi:MAG TPA: Na+/H+ antiporter subunit E [Phycisphaerales bacterium]|nr:Na+/H+ antiporter subunit E [Phycisphaerales bacterium]HMP36689.1 Na+/H+ antiporter subunit E [Phycisphaerales bacterium]